MISERQRKIMCGILAAAGAVILVLAFLVTVVEVSAFDGAYYVREYEKNDTAAEVGVPVETLHEATVNLLFYLVGQQDSLDMEADIDGQRQQYYNEREKLHMADVRDLNIGAIMFMWVGWLAGIILIVMAVIYSQNNKYQVAGVCFWSILGVLGFFGIIGVWGAADFGSFWTQFHHVFFRNNLWQFDPRTSRLIRMFEEQFFVDLVTQILTVFLIVVAVALVTCGVLYRWGKKRQAARSSAS